uniref:Methyltransf_21 domain-containing protein n=1 Tax=Panagrellus redivivus TaxID=6233 RepID=A0A7E4V059_PANRE
MQPLYINLLLKSFPADIVKDQTHAAAHCVKIDIGGATYNCLQNHNAFKISVESFKSSVALLTKAQELGDIKSAFVIEGMVNYHAENIKRCMEQYTKSLNHLLHAADHSTTFRLNLDNMDVIPGYNSKEEARSS